MAQKLKNGYTVVHEIREMTNFVVQGYDGVCLAHDGGAKWTVGRQFAGFSMRDGYSEAGDGGLVEWREGRHFGTPDADVANMRDAVARYFNRAEEIGVGDGMLRQRTHEAIARYAVSRMDLTGVPALVAGWGRTSDDGEGLMAPMGHTIPLPASEAVYELLGYMQRTEDPHPAQEIPWVFTPVKAWETVLGSAEQLRRTGRLKFEMGYNTYSLSAERSRLS